MCFNIDNIEIKVLKIGTLVNLIMAICGWVFYSLTNSQVLLLDGNFSFIIVISTFVAIQIVKNKHKKTNLFPYGKYFYEAFFVLFKGCLILGISIVAVFQNIVKIIDYFNGIVIQKLVAGPILIYSILMSSICFGLAFYYKTMNKKIQHKSSLLSVEAKSSLIDGYLSSIVGIMLVLTAKVSESSIFSFLLYIGDAIVVILLGLFIMKISIKIINEGFIELGGGTLQNPLEKGKIEAIITSKVLYAFLFDTYISKIGSSYLVVIYISSENDIIYLNNIENIHKQIKHCLKKKYTNVIVEFAFRTK